jgi:hypothetical protein
VLPVTIKSLQAPISQQSRSLRVVSCAFRHFEEADRIHASCRPDFP